MAREKRTKPCSNCKKSKVKCEYDERLPCVRCANMGHAASCLFAIKLPSISFPIEPHGPVSYKPPYKPPSPPVPARPVPATFVAPQIPAALPRLHALPSPASASPHLAQAPVASAHVLDAEWRSTVESKIDAVDSKFSAILSALEAQRTALLEERQLNDRYRAEKRPHEAPSKTALLPDPDGSPEPARKRLRFAEDDFRDSLLTLDQAKMLFQYFDDNIAQQLFGFEVKRFSVENIWNTSPLLICAICTIASMHYPSPAINNKQAALQAHLQGLCASLLLKGRPRNETEAFNSILALVLCSFWLADSQMFTGLALQLAKEFNLNTAKPLRLSKHTLAEKDRVKLWYLLFILDGQQSMTYNRQSLVSSEDYTIQNTRSILLDAPAQATLQTPSMEVARAPPPDHALEASSAGPASAFTDLRLISQVEYNVALSESFRGIAWDLLAPQSYGIPSKTNLELDKWMVSWTVLLAPMNNGAVWLSKSTLIYYNFAKMHINSSVIRQLQDPSANHEITLPSWTKYRPPEPVTTPASISNADSDDSDDEGFVTGGSVVAHNNFNEVKIAINAAQTVLNLVLNDPDILENLKYVPVHIHMMLYYAAILLVSAPAEHSSVSDNMLDALGRLRTVKTLQRKIYANLPTDRSFGDQLIRNLETLFTERADQLRQELLHLLLECSLKALLINEIASLGCLSALLMASSPSFSLLRTTSPKPERVLAWPGSNHGHP